MAQCLFSYLFTFGVYLQLYVYVHVGGARVCSCLWRSAVNLGVVHQKLSILAGHGGAHL